jgi:hypothetical protein
MLTAIPASIILSPSLTTVNLSRNNFTSISWNDPARPSQEVLQSRKDNSFFDSFSGTPTKSVFHDNDVDEIMPAIKAITLSSNGITNAGLPSRWPQNIECIDLSDNKLQGVLDLTVFASLPRLKHLNLRGNGIAGVVVRSDEENLWPLLESIDLEKNEIRTEAAVTERLKLGRAYTTGDAMNGLIQIVREATCDQSPDSDRETHRNYRRTPSYTALSGNHILLLSHTARLSQSPRKLSTLKRKFHRHWRQAKSRLEICDRQAR